MMSVQVTQIGNNVFQIIGKADVANELCQAFLLDKVTKLAEKAERHHGVPQNNIAHTTPAELVVHATYYFLSGVDIEAFLKEC